MSAVAPAGAGAGVGRQGTVAIDRLMPTPEVRRRSSHLDPQPAIAAARSGRVSKRLYDVVIAGALLVLALAAPVGARTRDQAGQPGPALFHSRRVGLRGRESATLKFRKMHDDAVGPPLTACERRPVHAHGLVPRPDQARRAAAVVERRPRRDEPRRARGQRLPVFVALHPDEYCAILDARPGITGLTQLAFAKESSVLDRDEFAGRYVDRRSPQKMTIDRLYVIRSSTGSTPRSSPGRSARRCC